MYRAVRQVGRWVVVLVALAAWMVSDGATANAHDTGEPHVHAAAQTLSVTPVSGAAGSTVQVEGCDWTKGEDIEFYFDDPADVIGTVIVDLAGNCFEGSVEIPASAAAGDHEIEARGGSGATAKDTFTVTAVELTIAPTKGPAGSPVDFAGCGWTPGSEVEIKWAATNAEVTKTTADGSGCISANGTLPAGVSPGVYVVNASSENVGTNASFTVTQPEITLTPDNGPSGSDITAGGCGWLAGETVSLEWTTTGQALASPVANGDGCINALFSVPAGQADGDYAVEGSGSDAADSRASATFTVQQPELLLFPDSGPGDSTIDAYGCGWTGNTQVTVKWSDTSTLGTSSLNANGCIDLDVTIPTAASVGDHTLTATGDNSGTATQIFEVTNNATLNVSPSSANIGDAVAVHGLGWADGEEVTLRWNNSTQLATTVAPADGSFVLLLDVPQYATVATHTINAEGDKGGSAQDTLTILPEAGMDIFPSSVPAGGWVEVCLYEWTDGERVSVIWPSGATLKQINYSATSDLCQTTAVFAMPDSVPPGAYTISATGNRGHTSEEQITIIADTEAPDVMASYSPGIVSDNPETVIEIRGEMTDNGGIAKAWITLIKNEAGATGETIQTCEPPPGKSASEPQVRVCKADVSSLEPGGYHFSIVAEDLAGNRGRDGGYVRVFKDGQAPAMQTSHAPTNLGINDTPSVKVEAQDDGGIKSLFIFIDGQTYPFTYNEPYPLSVSETINYAQTGGKRVIEYDALAFDVEGLSTRAAKRTMLFDNTGPDGDNDGLSDAIESYLCTNPNNPDSDRDFLLDGWEILGKSFSDGDLVDLPAEGANPCVRQVFLQLDWEEGVPFSAADLQNAVNTFQDHYVSLKLSGQERPWLTDPVTSTVGVFAASELTDGNGDYYFDPKKNWTHYYGYARNSPGRSGAWGNFFTINMWGSGDLYALIHELGHTMGLGHGGRDGTPTLKFNGDAPYYDGAWNNTNSKPNYLSIMNYRYSGKICYNQAANKWLWDLDYADTSMPDLDETDLDERPSSDFVQALQSRTCDSAPGYVPAIAYSCSDPDETEPDGSNTRYVMVSDGTTTLARKAAGRSLMTDTVPSHAPGIDWNCDGQISESVEENINGQRPGEICDNKDNDGDGDIDEKCGNSWTPSQTLKARFDWPLIPAGMRCHIMRHEDGRYPQGAAYRNDVLGIDCSTLPSAAGVTDVDGQDTDPEPHVDTEEILLFEEFPNVEICDGLDNDGNGIPDEGCLDADGDGVIDAIDNCPLTANSDQLDVDRNYIGDACEAPPEAPSNLIAVLETDGVALSWSPPQGNVVDGYSVYRLDPGDSTYRYIGEFPSTRDTVFKDTDASQNEDYQYVVRSVNRYGVEGPASAAALVGDSGNVYLPQVDG